MAQMDHAFRMGGGEITTPWQFCEHFSPADLLRHREMAAGFARRQLSSLSPWHNYHGELLFKAVFCWEDLYERGIPDSGEHWEERRYSSDFYEKTLRKDLDTGEEIVISCRSLVTGPEFYLNVPGVWRNVNSLWLSRESAALRGILMEACPETLRQLWDLSAETGLPQTEQKKLFLILSAGYFLAGKTRADCPISPGEARAAWLRETVKTAQGPVETGNTLVFAASDTPYEIPRSPLQTTSSIHTIALKKLAAVPSSQGATQKPALLRLGTEEIKLMPGEYRYASFINGQMVRIFPVKKENGALSMERRGNSILMSRDGQLLKSIDCTGRDIVDFAGDTEGNYILLEENRVDYSHFPGANLLPTANIIEVNIREDDVYQLGHRGRVTKNGRLYPATYPATLDYLKD